MDQCPKCGSTKIIKDMMLQSSSSEVAYAMLMNPNNKGEREHIGFRVSVCGNCGYSELKTNFYQDLWEAQEKGFVPYSTKK